MKNTYRLGLLYDFKYINNLYKVLSNIQKFLKIESIWEPKYSWDSFHWGQLARFVIPLPIRSRERISISISDFLLDFVAVCVTVCVCVRRLFVSIKLIDAHFSNLTKRSEKSISDKTFAGCLCLCRCTHSDSIPLPLLPSPIPFPAFILHFFAFFSLALFVLLFFFCCFCCF